MKLYTDERGQLSKGYVLRRLDGFSQCRTMCTYGSEFAYLEGDALNELVPG